MGLEEQNPEASLSASRSRKVQRSLWLIDIQ